MSDTEARLCALVDEHLDLGRAPSMDQPFADAGVSSLDCISFVKLVSKEFGFEIGADEWPNISNMRDLAARIDAAAG